MIIYSKCSDYATDICPCILAENGHCIECSQCRGENFCDCSDTASFCVMQELRNNGGKAKEPRRAHLCEVSYVKDYEDMFRLIRLRVPRDQVRDYSTIGSYVLVRVRDDPYFDVPVSVLHQAYDSDTIGLLIQYRGIKTNDFRTLRRGDTVHVRGPFFNGVQGRKAVASLRNSRALILCRGIGFLPSLSVMDSLRANGNSLDVYLDRGQFSGHVLDLYSGLFEIGIRETRISDETGALTEETRRIIEDSMQNGTALIHLGLSDYLIGQLIRHLEEKQYAGAVSFINNARICCGEGICGACTRDIGPGRMVHLCKEQLNCSEYHRIYG